MRYTWAECREFLGDDGRIIGTIISFSYAGQDWNIVLIHNWATGDEEPYTPVCIGQLDNAIAAKRFIEMAAQNARPPLTLVKNPLE